MGAHARHDSRQGGARRLQSWTSNWARMRPVPLAHSSLSSTPSPRKPIVLAHLRAQEGRSVGRRCARPLLRSRGLSRRHERAKFLDRAEVRDELAARRRGRAACRTRCSRGSGRARHTAWRPSRASRRRAPTARRRRARRTAAGKPPSATSAPQPSAAASHRTAITRSSFGTGSTNRRSRKNGSSACLAAQLDDLQKTLVVTARARRRCGGSGCAARRSRAACALRPPDWWSSPPTRYRCARPRELQRARAMACRGSGGFRWGRP